LDKHIPVIDLVLDETMKPISRDEMEKRLKASKVIHSAMEQDSREIRIRLELDSRQTFIVRYDLENRTKDYLFSENV